MASIERTTSTAHCLRAANENVWLMRRAEEKAGSWGACPLGAFGLSAGTRLSEWQGWQGFGH
jgi:hypothetical protein